ncbi:hypothetical protein CoNPh26_CDS0078 [Staphylococcus phage S-CoN_Ph26]|nr:hypothetical protein CoNPh26_CDS0078 [Staphylococcus phage S-CoN_Ph26]
MRRNRSYFATDLSNGSRQLCLYHRQKSIAIIFYNLRLRYLACKNGNVQQGLTSF